MNLITGFLSTEIWQRISHQMPSSAITGECFYTIYIYRLPNVSEIIYDDWWIIDSVDWLKLWQHMTNEAMLITLAWNT